MNGHRSSRRRHYRKERQRLKHAARKFWEAILNSREFQESLRRAIEYEVARPEGFIFTSLVETLDNNDQSAL